MLFWWVFLKKEKQKTQTAQLAATQFEVQRISVLCLTFMVLLKHNFIFFSSSVLLPGRLQKVQEKPAWPKCLQREERSLLYPRICRTPMSFFAQRGHPCITSACLCSCKRRKENVISIAGTATHSMEDHGSSVSSTHTLSPTLDSLKSNYGTNRL